MSAPKVSFVCSIYNRADYIGETVDSLLRQDYPNYEIIIVNDGSSDFRVREILDGYNDPRLRIIHQANTGFTRAIRRAIDESDGDFIALQGAGDISLPCRLSAQVAYLVARPKHAVLGCRYVNNVKAHDGIRYTKLSKLYSFNPTAKDIIHGNPFSHGEVLMRRKAYDEVGGYRIFFDNAQDKDLWLRMSMHYKLGILDACFYERNIFTTDGIASSFAKALKQLAYSRIADLCYLDRIQGKPDTVDEFGQLALMLVPRGWRTTWKIIKLVKQITDYSSLKPSEFFYVYKLFGAFNAFIAIIFWRFYLIHHK